MSGIGSYLRLGHTMGLGDPCDVGTPEWDRRACETKKGSDGGAAVATDLLGPEAAPLGAIVGGYIGDHFEDWAGGAWSTIKGWVSSPAACYCQLGACTDDDDWDINKFAALRANCKSAGTRALIDKLIVDQVNIFRAASTSMPAVLREAVEAEANEIENCAKLAAYKQCADSGWEPAQPAPEKSKFEINDAMCKSHGFIGWNGTDCVPVPVTPKGCSKGGLYGVPGYYSDKSTGECITCEHGVKIDRVPGDTTSAIRIFSCYADNQNGLIDSASGPGPTGIGAKFAALSTPAKAATVIGGALLLWTGARVAMKLPVVPKSFPKIKLRGKR